MDDIPIIRPKMPELDSLRGVAILCVLFYHGFYWSNGLTGLSGPAKAFVSLTRFGWLGINLFFVLSGFLITGILIESQQRADYYKRFYIRRALRIFPAFYAVLVLLALTPSQSGRFLVLSFFYLANFAPLFAVPMTYAMFWSLAVEEHFYFLWPLIVRQASRAWLLATAIAIVLFVPALRALAFRPNLPEGFAYYTWFVADGLAIGAILALTVRAPGFSRRNLAQFSGAAIFFSLLLLVGGAPWGMLTRQRILGATFMLTATQFLFAGLLGAALLAGTSKRRWAVNRPVLQFFGVISYGLYLIHWLAFVWYDSVVKKFWPNAFPSSGHALLILLRFAVAAGAAVAISYLSRRFFEEPFLRLKDRLGA